MSKKKKKDLKSGQNGHQVAEEEMKNQEGAGEEENQRQEANEASDQDIQDEQGEELKAEMDEEISEMDKLKSELSEAKDKFLRLYSEFENYRRRTSKERLELINTANEELMAALLPIVDDFERADKAFDEQGDAKSLKEGYDLIQNKFRNILTQKGLKPMEDKVGDDFNPEFHEAVTQIPAPEDKLKGKIVDIIERGYFLNEKVIRFAKVVTGS